jgi:glutathione S-transferase
VVGIEPDTDILKRQPDVMPRPDIAALGVKYRRIPVCAIGGDIYLDTRLMIQKLEELYPNSPLTSGQTTEQRALERVLSRWNVDGGVFFRASALIPTNLPNMQDQKFLKDREDLTGRPWSLAAIEQGRGESLSEIFHSFSIIEDLFSDGRDWVLGTKEPALADIELIWPFDWLTTLPGALPASTKTTYPKTFAWMARFNDLVKQKSAALGRPKRVKGPEAIEKILNSSSPEVIDTVVANDPLGLEKGQEIKVWPLDSGMKQRDVGKLIGLTAGVGGEVVFEVKTQIEGKTVKVHAPRHGFRIVKSGGARL